MREPTMPQCVRLGRPYSLTRPRETTPHADKAISQRATLLAALADGRSQISNLAHCNDTAANLRALEQLGVVTTGDADGLWIDGVGGSRRLQYRGDALDVGNSATTARLLIAILAGSRSECVVDGNSALRGRPMAWLVDPLRQLGADLTYVGSPGRLPVRVSGRPLHGGALNVRVDSAQPVSSLLFAGLAAHDEVVIDRRTAARDHTERLLQWCGVDVTAHPHRLELTPGRPRAFDLTVPGDPSAAAVLAALHLASPGATATLTICDVSLNPTRLGFFHVMRCLGAQVSWREDSERTGPEPVGSLFVTGPLVLSGGEIAGRDLIQATIDELPLLAALASTARDRVVIRDAAELKDKDTDRIAETVHLLTAFGVATEATEDGLVVWPSSPQAPTTVSLPHDHRLVFAGCVLSLLAGGDVVLDGMEAAATSHPGLIKDLSHYLPVEVL